MNPWVARNAYDERRAERRRLVAGILVLLVLALGWHLVRPTLVQWMACRSVGCLGRERLLAVALRRAGVPGSSDVPFESWWSTHSLPEPWISWPRFAPLREGEPVGTAQRLGSYYADADLRVRGCLMDGQYGALDGPGDMDGDGCWEIATQFYADHREPPSLEVSRWAIVRLDGANNELLAVLLVDQTLHRPRGVRIRPLWRDDDGDGTVEYQCVTVSAAIGPAGRPLFQPPRTLARLDWTGPGGVLIPTLLPDDGSIQVWTPPDGRPSRFSADDEIEPLLDRVFPVPAQYLAPNTSSKVLLNGREGLGNPNE